MNAILSAPQLIIFGVVLAPLSTLTAIAISGIL
jgi:hypothetical protein